MTNGSWFDTYLPVMPTLVTPRLMLRKVAISDAVDMYEYASDERTTKFLVWEPHGSQKYTKNYVKYLQKQYNDKKYFDWAITLRETGKMIGTCGFTSIVPEHARAELGYVINPAYWGSGIAAEAAEAVMKLAFEKLDINRIEAKHIVGNEASGAVMEKLGMKKEGVLREYMYIKGNYEDICMYSITAEDYFKKRYNIGVE